MTRQELMQALTSWGRRTGRTALAQLRLTDTGRPGLAGEVAKHLAAAEAERDQAQQSILALEDERAKLHEQLAANEQVIEDLHNQLAAAHAPPPASSEPAPQETPHAQ